MSEPRPRIPPSLTPRDAPVTDEPWPQPPEPPEAPKPRRSIGRRIWRGVLWTVLALHVVAMIPPGYVLWLRWHAPTTTAFMIQSEVQPVEYHWVPASQIPEPLRLAVVAAEDQKFFTHWGFDFMAIAEALEHNEKSKKKRGASTISQQTAKNLFLWPSRSWVRKGLEVTFTLLLEGLWSKDRILEVYLNIAEFGPGVYGVEAAAQKFFHKGSDQLTPAECAQLAAVLPNPSKWHADRPGPYVQRRVDWILGQIGQPPRYAAVPETEPEVIMEGEEPGETEAPEGATPPAGEPASGDGAVEQVPTAPAPAAGEPAPAPPAESPATSPGEAPAEPAPDSTPEEPPQPP